MTKSTKNKRKPKVRKKVEKSTKKRSKMKYPYLNKSVNLKIRSDYIEPGYVNGVRSVDGSGEGIRPLNEEELEWLNKFYSEYVGASVSSKDEERLEKQLHNTPELAKDCTDKNNARNRCLYNRSKITDKLKLRSWKEFDQNTMRVLGNYDLELLNLYSSGVLNEVGNEEDDED